MRRRRHFLMLILLFAGTAAWVVAQPSEEELEQNRRKLEAVRKSPEELARLRANLQQFLALPPNNRDKMVHLDQELHELPGSVELDQVAGSEKLVAVFSNEPVDAKVLQQAVDTNPAAPEVKDAKVISLEFMKAAK